jgi:hypothetical protein
MNCIIVTNEARKNFNIVFELSSRMMIGWIKLQKNLSNAEFNLGYYVKTVIERVGYFSYMYRSEKYCFCLANI